MLQISRLEPGTKMRNLLKNKPQQGPQIHLKSMKIQPWIPRCPLWCPSGPLDHQHGGPRCKIQASGYQNASQATNQQPEGAGGRGEALRYIHISNIILLPPHPNTPNPTCWGGVGGVGWGIGGVGVVG